MGLHKHCIYHPSKKKPSGVRVVLRIAEDEVIDRIFLAKKVGSLDEAREQAKNFVKNTLFYKFGRRNYGLKEVVTNEDPLILSDLLKPSGAIKDGMYHYVTIIKRRLYFRYVVVFTLSAKTHTKVFSYDGTTSFSCDDLPEGSNPKEQALLRANIYYDDILKMHGSDVFATARYLPRT